ncbi:ROK family protein [Streptomyces sp. ODS28]|uniref:ROK family protein n=1 Tax=Streptomyces sp. ODS28 TaxID=3136688 RepID=UPI0031F0B2A4
MTGRQGVAGREGVAVRAAAGPNGSPLTGRWALGADVGGTKIATGLVGPDGSVHAPHTVPTPAREGAAAILDAVAGALRPALDAVPEGVTPYGLGLGTGGVVDHAAGRIVSATSLLAGWAGVPAARELERRLGLPVRVDNDARALALGELHFGAARGRDSVLFAAVGTGIGGALVLQGELLRGEFPCAGEIGHLPVALAAAEGAECSCGRTGHLEAVAAGPGMTRTYARRGGAPAPDLRAVVERAHAGDALARQVVTEGAACLGGALGGLVNALGVGAVVIGGGVPGIGPLYWDALEPALRAELLPACADVAVLPARLGSGAAVAGAAALWATP